MQNPVLTRRKRSSVVGSALLLPLLLLAALAVPGLAAAEEPLVPVVCYAPGTPADVVEKSSRPPSVSGRRGLPTSLT
ncbi:MAG TPA: hypothetical protein VMW27_15465, partial [Thermoanaerobaculia bacterium]|nr:hypothetical protein [Thermoanaerobaculia bacterium]